MGRNWARLRSGEHRPRQKAASEPKNCIFQLIDFIGNWTHTQKKTEITIIGKIVMMISQDNNHSDNSTKTICCSPFNGSPLNENQWRIYFCTHHSAQLPPADIIISCRQAGKGKLLYIVDLVRGWLLSQAAETCRTKYTVLICSHKSTHVFSTPCSVICAPWATD